MLAFAGGILGVLMMVPLRRALIVKEHGVLPYPEGAACADVLIAGERGGALAKTVFTRPRRRRALEGAVLDRPDLPDRRSATRWRGPASSRTRPLNVDISPEYMGVGYVIGPRIAGVMFAGGVLSWLVLLPLLSIMGNYMTVPFPPVPASGLRIDQMSAEPVVERLHPLHRRRRRARVGPHHAGADDPDDRLVVPRQHEGLQRRARRRRRGSAPSATCR